MCPSTWVAVGSFGPLENGSGFKKERMSQKPEKFRRVGPELLRDTAEERLFNALKSMIYCGPMDPMDFRQYVQNVAGTALQEWADLRCPELNCHGNTV